MALVGLIVFAMAAVMPWAESLWADVLPEGFFHSTSKRSQRIHHVIVLDGSLSMNVTVEGKPAFEHARQLAIRQVEASRGGGRVQRAATQGQPGWIVPEASQDRRKVLRELEAVRPSHGNAALPAGLNMVAGKLTEAAQRFPAQARLLHYRPAKGDLAVRRHPGDRGGGREGKERPDRDQPAGPHRLRGRRPRRPQQSGRHRPVTSASRSSPPASRCPSGARVQNYGPEPRKNLRVELLVGKARETANDAGLALRVVGQDLRPEVRPGDRTSVDFFAQVPGRRHLRRPGPARRRRAWSRTTAGPSS